MSKRYLNVQDVMDIIGGSDSDIGGDEESEVSDDDEEYQPLQPQSSDESDDSSDDNMDGPGFIPVAVRYHIPPSTSSAVEPQPSTSRGKCSASGPPSKSKKVKPTYNWKKVQFQPHGSTFTGQTENNDFQDSLPLELFSKFISEDMLKMVVEQTNLYSFQKTGKVIKLDIKELRQTIGMFLMMGVIRLESQRDYWAEETRINKIADVIVRNRFQTILINIHFADNLDESIKIGKIWKISPWLEKFRTQCLNATPPTEYSSVDEMIVPFQGKFSKIKQYIKGKPHPWGFKIWARTDSDGILQDFELYQGKNETMPPRAVAPTATRSAANATSCQSQPAPRWSASPAQRSNTSSPTPTLTVPPPMTKLQRFLADASSFGLGTDTVLKLCATLPEDQNYKVCADNFFSGVQLVEKLLESGIHYIGTVRKNRLPACDLKNEKVLEKEGRGACDHRVEVDRKIIAVRWMDTKCVTLLSSHIGVDPKENVSRWDKKTKAFRAVPRPNIVKIYNEFMGGVDYLDRMCAKCRYQIRSKRWYMHIFWYTIKIALANSWIMYRRKHLAMGDAKKDIMKLKTYQAYVATCLMKSDVDTGRKRGRPSLEQDEVPSAPPKKQPRIQPPAEVRFDGIDHRINFTTRGKCARCKTGFCETCCKKCNIRLCIKKS